VLGALAKLFKRTLAAARAALYVLGVAMLFSFPANRVDRLDVHLRTPEVRRAIVRNTFIGRPEATGAEQIERETVTPSLAQVILAAVLPQPVTNHLIVSQILHTRFLLRLKSPPRPSPGSDPLSLL